jgi:iron complex outermembrane recepter protein
VIKTASLLFVICFGLFTISIKAQNGGPQFNGGSAIGIVSDSASGNAVEYASIVVITAADSAVKGGGVTGKDGSFSIQKLPAGKFMLRITFMGYNAWYSKPFMITPANPQFDAGAIKIKPENTQLGEVKITEQRSDYTNSIDKKVYDVDQNITNAGGTATDILQNIPSVTVDVDGKVSLRGSENVTILIDGKPSGVTGEDRNAVLQQIPANMIERIEIITNPSAKYDAQGMAGIINIITKKEKGNGYNGTVNGAVGTGNKYNGGISVNARNGKANLFASYNYRYEDRWGHFFTNQFNNTADTTYSFNSTGGSLQGSVFHSGRIGTDIYLNPYNTLSLAAGYTFRNEMKIDSANYAFLDSAENVTSTFGRLAEGTDHTHTIDATADYRKQFPGSTRTFSSAASFSTNQRGVDNSYKLSSFGYENSPYQTNFADNIFYSATAQADYAHPLSDSFKLETGIKYSLRDYTNDQSGQQFNYISGEYIDDARFIDKFRFTENVGAAYVQMNMHRGKWDYLGGVRAEYTSITGSSTSQDTTFTNSYLNLFPNLAIRRIFEKTEMQLSYGRRLNRPGNGQLNPFIDYTDSINLRAGNPFLMPEYIHSFDFTVSQARKAFSWSATLYYRHSENVITMARLFDFTTGQAVVKPRNFTSSDNFGTELVYRMPFGKKGSMMISGSAYYNIVNGDNIEADLQSAGFQYNARVTANYRIRPTTSIQLSGMYFSPFIQPIGQFWMLGGIDLGVRQEIFKGKAQISANLTDIMNTREFKMKNYTSEYEFRAGRKRESMVLMLNFTWRFGSNEEIAKRKVQTVIPQDDMQGGGGF